MFPYEFSQLLNIFLAFNKLISYKHPKPVKAKTSSNSRAQTCNYTSFIKIQQENLHKCIFFNHKYCDNIYLILLLQYWDNIVVLNTFIQHNHITDAERKPSN